MVNPGGTGSPARVISATPAPLPPRRSRRSLFPSSKRYTHFFWVVAWDGGRACVLTAMAQILLGGTTTPSGYQADLATQARLGGGRQKPAPGEPRVAGCP